MHGGYNVELYVWGYHGGTEDQVGPKRQRFWVDAQDFKTAVEMADMVLCGIKVNPNVFQAGIESVIGVSGQEDRWPKVQQIAAKLG